MFEYFLPEYRAGRTPNPDVLCNREIKFGICLDYAARLGARRFATGHYARLDARRRRPGAAKARDAEKDQSYFLHAVDRAHFARRAVSARRADQEPRCARWRARPACRCSTSPTAPASVSSANARSANSSRATSRRRRATSCTESGERRRAHRGLAFYTLGQRGGLEIGGRAGAREEAWYVAAKDLRAQRARRGPGTRSSPARKSCTGHGPLQLAGATAMRLNSIRTIKVRYRQADQPCHATLRRGWRDPRAFRRAAARGDARAIRGVVRRRSLPRRRGDRAHDARSGLTARLS